MQAFNRWQNYINADVQLVRKVDIHSVFTLQSYGTLLIFYWRHMAAFYCVQLKYFKQGLTSFFLSKVIYCIKSPYLKRFPANISRVQLTDWGVTIIFSEKVLPAFNGLTYITVQRANKGSLVEVLELHNVTHRCPTQQDVECSISCLYRRH